jgi:hypothetical protein
MALEELCKTCGNERFICDKSEARKTVPAGCGMPMCQNNRRPCPECTKNGTLVYVPDYPGHAGCV